MAFKMKGMNFGEGSGSSPNKEVERNLSYGTSIRDLTDLSREEKGNYMKWKRSERSAGRKGAHHDNTYEAYLSSRDTKQSKPKKNRKGLGIGKWLKGIFKPGDGGKKLLPSTIAEKRENTNT